MRRRLLSFLCALVLLCSVALPTRADTTVCFTAINDRLLSLTNEMPLWSDGTLYVPYWVFDVNTTGSTLRTGATYSRSSSNVAIFTLHQMLVFNLNTGQCLNEYTGELLDGRAILRNGTAYVPVALVCSFFGLDYTYLYSEYGYLVRIIIPDQIILSDKAFVDAASRSMRDRLRTYNQTLAAQQPSEPEPPVTEPTPPPPVVTPEPDAIPTHLAVRCDTGEATLSIAETLEAQGLSALFFFPAQDIAKNGPLIRRLMGHGHSIGIMAWGASDQECRDLLDLGSQSLRTVARSRTYFALVPDKHQGDLEADGWVLWATTADLTPDGSRTPYNHASRAVRALPKLDQANLILSDTQLSADAALNLLRQLESRGYTVAIPRETRF